MNRGAKTEAKKLMCLLAVLLMEACSGNSVIRRMEQIKTVGNHDPEKALVMLDSLQNAVKSEGEYVGNKYELLRIRLSDKANVIHREHWNTSLSRSTLPSTTRRNATPSCLGTLTLTFITFFIW